MSDLQSLTAVAELWTYEKAFAASKANPFWTPLDVWWMRERILQALLDDPDDGGRG